MLSLKLLLLLFYLINFYDIYFLLELGIFGNFRLGVNDGNLGVLVCYIYIDFLNYLL